MNTVKKRNDTVAVLFIKSNVHLDGMWIRIKCEHRRTLATGISLSKQFGHKLGTNILCVYFQQIPQYTETSFLNFQDEPNSSSTSDTET